MYDNWKLASPYNNLRGEVGYVEFTLTFDYEDGATEYAVQLLRGELLNYEIEIYNEDNERVYIWGSGEIKFETSNAPDTIEEDEIWHHFYMCFYQEETLKNLEVEKGIWEPSCRPKESNK